MYRNELVFSKVPKLNQWFSEKEEGITNVEIKTYTIREVIENTIDKVIVEYHNFIYDNGEEPEKIIMGLDFYQSLVCSVYSKTGRINLESFMDKEMILIPGFKGFSWLGNNKNTLSDMMCG